MSLRSVYIESIVESILGTAVRDAKRARANDIDLRAIGVGFFTPYLRKKWSDKIDDEIQNAINKFQDSDFHALA